MRATETLNGDGEVSESHKEALKIDGVGLKSHGELKSNREPFRAKKRHKRLRKGLQFQGRGDDLKATNTYSCLPLAHPHSHI